MADHDKEFAERMEALREATVAERVAGLREARKPKMSQGDLAKLAGVSRNHIWRIENGQRTRISAAIMARIADALGVSYNYLAGVDEEAAPLEPAPELRMVVRRANRLPPDQRRRLAGIVSAILDYGELIPVPAPSEAARRWLRVLQNLQPDELVGYLAEFAERVDASLDDVPLEAAPEDGGEPDAEAV